MIDLTSVQTRKITINLKIVQIEEKTYFYRIISFEKKGKTVSKLNQMLYSGPGHFYNGFFITFEWNSCIKRQDKHLFVHLLTN